MHAARLHLCGHSVSVWTFIATARTFSTLCNHATLVSTGPTQSIVLKTVAMQIPLYQGDEFRWRCVSLEISVICYFLRIDVEIYVRGIAGRPGGSKCSEIHSRLSSKLGAFTQSRRSGFFSYHAW